MSRRRNRHGGAHDNHERWLITYADLITLLMIFFVILYSMSKVDVSKFETLSVSLSQALSSQNQVPINSITPTGKGQDSNTNTPPTPVSQQDIEKLKKQEEESQRLKDIVEKLKAFVQQNGLQDKVQILEDARGVQITLRDVALFDLGSASLKPEAARVLGGISPFLKGLSNKISIEGHTDNLPIKSGSFQSNWELSSARSLNVLHYFETQGIGSDRLSATGYGEYQPVAKNDSEDGRAANRRVNVILLRNVIN